jgi:peptide/nickel transport system substrate-binding protein
MLISWLLKRKLLLIIPLILVLAIAAACKGDTGPAPAPTAMAPAPTATSRPAPTATPTKAAPAAMYEPPGKRGGILTYIPIQDCGLLDSLPNSDWCASNHQTAVHDTLFGQDVNGEVQPQMVGEWSVSPDGLTYTMTFRDGLMYHDGRPVLAENAIASLDRWAAKDRGAKAIFDPFVVKTEALDDKTFQIILNEPVGLVLPVMSRPRLNGSVIVQAPEDSALDPLTHAPNEIGSGPFKFVLWEPGNKLIWERWDDYKPRNEPTSSWAGGKHVLLDGVDNQFVVDPNTRAALLEAGEVDMVHQLPADLFPVLDANAGIVSFFDPQANMNRMVFNTTVSPSDNVLFRQALAMAVDQAEYVAAMQPEPFARVCYSVWGCETTLETEAGADRFLAPADLDAAKDLLAQSGYAGETVVLMAAANFTEIFNAALVTDKLLTAMGVNVDFQQMDWTAMAERRNVRNDPDDGGWNVYHTWGPSREPHEQFDPTFVGWYENAEIAALQKDYMVAQTLDERKSIALAVQEIYMDELPDIIVGEHFGFNGHRTEVKDFINTMIHPFWQVWLDR